MVGVINFDIDGEQTKFLSAYLVYSEYKVLGSRDILTEPITFPDVYPNTAVGGSGTYSRRR